MEELDMSAELAVGTEDAAEERVLPAHRVAGKEQSAAGQEPAGEQAQTPAAEAPQEQALDTSAELAVAAEEVAEQVLPAQGVAGKDQSAAGQEPAGEQAQTPAAEAPQEQAPIQTPKRERGRPRKTEASEWEILEELSVAFAEAGLECPGDLGRDKADGKWHRCRGEGQTGSVSGGCGAYLLEWDERRPRLVAYNFAGDRCSIRLFRHASMTRRESRELERIKKERRKELLRQDKLEADDAAVRAQEEWARLSPLESVCGYLEAKSLQDVYGLRGTADRIAVPLRNADGQLRAIQTITKEDGGFKKLFTKGCRMPGLYFEFPEDPNGTGPIAVGEGLATVGTVVDVMGWHGVVALDCGNLDAVVGAVRELYPKRPVVVLADNDAFWNSDAGGSRPHRKDERRPDEDNVGLVKARAAAQKYGAKLAIPPLAGGKCTDFNDLYVRSGGGEAGARAVKSALEGAHYVPGCSVPHGFRLILNAPEGQTPGLYAEKDTKAGPEIVRVGPPLLVEAHVTGSDGNLGWGLLVSWQDPRGAGHRIAIPRADLATRDRVWLAPLVGGGYMADSGYAGDLQRFLERCEPKRFVTAPAKTGWLDDGISSFVLPERVIGAPAGVDPADIVYSGPVTAMYKRAGTLEEWKNQVAALAVGNVKLTFGLCAAFAGPLLHAVGASNAGFHFVGPSSSGKSTIVQLAHSAWDDFESMGTWRSTDNGKEAEALSRNDTLLCLDEINQANPKSVGSVVYMLGNGQGKARSRKDGSLREQKRFRLVFLSSGEASLESVITSNGGTHMAGMDVRAIHVPVDKHDVMDFHGAGSAGALCGAVKAGARKWHGTAGPAFVERLIPVLADGESKLRHLLRREGLQAIGSDIVRSAGYDADTSDPQIQRISESFALVCVAGMLAVCFGILPESVKIRDACIKIFQECVEFRGGTSSQEETKIVEITSTFLISNEESMFINVDDDGEKEERIISRPIAGFTRYIDGVLHYYVLPKIMHDVWSGIAINEALQVLEKKKFIIPSPSQRGRRHFQQLVTIPGNGTRQWMYCLTIPDAEDAPAA